MYTKYRNACVPPFQLATPSGFQVNNIPKGNLVLLLCTPSIKLTFFSGIPYKTFLFCPRLFSRALGCGARRGAACTRRCKCGPRPGSVTRALGAHWSRDPASNHGVAFRGARAGQDN